MIYLSYNKFKISDFGKALIRFTSTQIISNFVNFLSGFLVIRLIDPESYGQFTGIGVYAGYILLGQCGIINGLGRELPYELGRKNVDYAKQLASSAYVFSVLICIISFLIFFVIGITHLFDGNKLISIIFFTYAIIGGISPLSKDFFPTMYRTNKHFDLLSKQNIYVSITNLITVALVYFFSIFGLIARSIILAVIEFILLKKNNPQKISFKYHIDNLKTLFKTGFPLYIFSQVNHFWYTILNSIIYSLGGPINYGLYALSNIINGSFGVIPKSFVRVIYPRMSTMFGEGESVSNIIKSNIKPLIFQFIFMLGISFVSVLILPTIIPLLLPNYTGGILAAQWMLFVPVIGSFGSINNIYIVVKKLKLYLFSLITGIIIGSLFIYFKIASGGFHLEIFSQGLLIVTVIQQGLCLFFIFIFSKKW